MVYKKKQGSGESSGSTSTEQEADFKDVNDKDKKE
jgi:hypothetical protein